MSATHRGIERAASDFYPTPDYSIDSFLNNYKLKDGVMLEPCAGNGSLIRSIRKYGYKNKILANEIRSEEIENLKLSGANEILTCDFLNEYKTNDKVSTIITNPPFSEAIPFIEKCLNTYPDAEVIMLLRVALLETNKRHEFWQQYGINKLFVLSRRPKFTGRCPDATAYGWFVWDHSNKQEIKIIA